MLIRLSWLTSSMSIICWLSSALTDIHSLRSAFVCRQPVYISQSYALLHVCCILHVSHSKPLLVISQHAGRAKQGKSGHQCIHLTSSSASMYPLLSTSSLEKVRCTIFSFFST